MSFGFRVRMGVVCDDEFAATAWELMCTCWLTTEHVGTDPYGRPVYNPQNMVVSIPSAQLPNPKT